MNRGSVTRSGRARRFESSRKRLKKVASISNERYFEMDVAASARLYGACHCHPVGSRLVSAVCQVLEWSGDGRAWFALLLVAWWRALLPDAAVLLLARLLVLDLALVGGLKWAVKRRRPTYGSLRPAGYVVEVDRTRVENPPADASSFRYRLVELVSKDPEA